METSQIKYLRELYKEDDLFIFCADNIFFDGKRQGSRLIWDDSNNLVHSIRVGTEYHIVNDKPIEVKSIDYGIIEYLSDVYDIKGLEIFLQNLKSKNLINNDKLNKIIEEFKLLTTY